MIDELPAAAEPDPLRELGEEDQHVDDISVRVTVDRRPETCDAAKAPSALAWRRTRARLARALRAADPDGRRVSCMRCRSAARTASSSGASRGRDGDSSTAVSLTVDVTHRRSGSYRDRRGHAEPKSGADRSPAPIGPCKLRASGVLATRAVRGQLGPRGAIAPIATCSRRLTTSANRPSMRHAADRVRGERRQLVRRIHHQTSRGRVCQCRRRRLPRCPRTGSRT